MGKAWMPVQNFKKVHEDGRKVILEHPDGHSVTLAKSAMSDHMKQQVAQLPSHQRKAKGGQVKKMDDGGAPASSCAPALPGPPPGEPTPFAQLNPGDPAGAAHLAATQQSMQPQTGAQMAGAMPAGPQNYNLGMNQKPNGPQPPNYFQQLYGAQQQAAQKQAQVYQQMAQQQQQIYGRAMQIQNNMMQDYTNFKNDYLQGHIDPNHYLDSMSSGGKIATAIGVLLGGIGGAMSHQPNQALQFLNNQIDRDIQGQIVNMDKNVNLMKVNMQMYGNMNQAIEMTRAQEMGIMSAKIQQIAAQSQSKQAQLLAKQFSSQYDGQASQLIRGLAMSQAMGLPSSQMIQGPGGQPSFAMSPEAAQTVREKSTALDHMQAGVDQLEQNMNQKGSNWSLNPFTGFGHWSARAHEDEALQDNVAQQMANALYGQGRYNENQLNDLKSHIPSPGQFRQGMGHQQVAQLRNWIAQMRNSLLQNNTFGGAPPQPMTGAAQGGQ